MKKTTQNVVRNVSGRFRRKIQRHESVALDERAPPMTGPMPLAMATTAPWQALEEPQEDARKTHKDALVLSALTQGNDITDDQLGNRHQATAADTSKGTKYR